VAPKPLDCEVCGTHGSVDHACGSCGARLCSECKKPSNHNDTCTYSDKDEEDGDG